MWLEFAEDQARRRKEVFLKDWAERLDAFFKFNERDVLDGAGRVSKEAGRRARGGSIRSVRRPAQGAAGS